MKQRDWDDARLKIQGEGACRVCGLRPASFELEAMHTIGRKHDREVRPGVFYVNPADVIPGCRACHVAYDKREVDILPVLTLAEQASAVRHVGIEAARRRTAPSTHM